MFIVVAFLLPPTLPFYYMLANFASMVIYDINGNKIIDATLTSGAEHEEE